MDQAQPELTLDESVKQVMQTLPPPIRAYLAGGKYTVVAKNLMSKYGLRIDQGGVLEREIMLLLMGIENPDDFTKALIEEAKLDQNTINSIVQDINAQIFMPLREEEMKSKVGGVSPVAPPTPARPTSVGVPNYAARAPVQNSYAPPPQSPRYPGQDNVNAFVRRVQPSPVNTPPPPPSISVITPPPNLPGTLPPPAAPKSTPTPPAPYVADPYHEPIE